MFLLISSHDNENLSKNRSETNKIFTIFKYTHKYHFFKLLRLFQMRTSFYTKNRLSNNFSENDVVSKKKFEGVAFESINCLIIVISP